MGRADDDAPVSRASADLAFEQPVIGGPHHRHHVHFLALGQSCTRVGPSGSVRATFDERWNSASTTGQVAHHIRADVDTERDHIANELPTGGPGGVNRMVPWLSLQPGRRDRQRRSLAHRWSTGDCRNVRFRTARQSSTSTVPLSTEFVVFGWICRTRVRIRTLTVIRTDP